MSFKLWFPTQGDNKCILIKCEFCRLRRDRAASWRGNVGFLPRSQGVVMQTKIALIIRKIEVKRKQFPLAGYKHGQTRNRESSLCAENGR